MYRYITRRKTWVRIVMYLLAYIYGVKLSYEEMLGFTKERLDDYLKKEDPNPTSLETFDHRLKSKHFDYQKELVEVSNLHFYQEDILISKNKVVFPKVNVKKHIYKEFYQNKYFCEAFAFLRYHPIVHHLLVFADVRLTSKTYKISIPSLYRIKSSAKFEFDTPSHSFRSIYVTSKGMRGCTLLENYKKRVEIIATLFKKYINAL